MLLPSGLVKLMSLGFRWGQAFYVLPFTWDDTNGRARLATSATRRAGWVLSIVVSVICAIVCTFHLVQYWSSAELGKDPSLRFNCVFVILALWSFVAYESCMVLQYKEIPQMVNAILDYMDTFNCMF